MSPDDKSLAMADGGTVTFDRLLIATGSEVALACDLVVAKKSAAFLQAFSKLGLIPDTGGTWFLPHTVGDARARALAMLGIVAPAPSCGLTGFECLPLLWLLGRLRQPGRP